MAGPVFALTPFPWPYRLAIFLDIALLTFFSVSVRARLARRRGRLFPLGSLVLCACTLCGSVMDVARGPFLEFTGVGLLCGGVAGGLLGLVRALPAPAKVAKPGASVGVRDRDYDGPP